jgi:hypothetical protein
MSHDLGQISLWCFQQKVVMVAHQAIGLDEGAITLGCRCQIFQKLLPVSLAFEYLLLFIAS